LLERVHWLPVLSVLLIVAGLTVVLVDRSLYPVAVVTLLSALTLATLAGKEPE
jgi:hypothetical protein